MLLDGVVGLGHGRVVVVVLDEELLGLLGADSGTPDVLATLQLLLVVVNVHAGGAARARVAECARVDARRRATLLAACDQFAAVMRARVPGHRCFVGRWHAVHVRALVGLGHDLNRVVLAARWVSTSGFSSLMLSQKLTIFVKQLVSHVFHRLNLA